MISDSDSEGNYNIHILHFQVMKKRYIIQGHFSRRDVCSHFIRGRVIPNDVLLRILTAAHHAPSVDFSQPWTFVLIKDKSNRAQVKDSFFLKRA
jgi:5,6-dimethylbenzimidazole synthase